PVVDRVVRDDPGERLDLVLDRHCLPGERQHVAVVLPILHLPGQILHGAHAVELTDPVVPHLTAVRRTASRDGRDQLLARLRLRYEFHLHFEVLLRLVEPLDERLHKCVALRLRHAELKAHGCCTPGPPGTHQRFFPPREVGGGDGSYRGHGFEQLPARQDPLIVHHLPPSFKASHRTLRHALRAALKTDKARAGELYQESWSEGDALLSASAGLESPHPGWPRCAR